jgi:bifunctional non-homologous end joining protein LigD
MKPADYDPQKALLVESPPVGDRWLHEVKLDGFRMGLFIARRGVHIISRRGTRFTAAYPEIAHAATQLAATSAIIDGEVVVLDKRGRSNFQLLQQLGDSRTGLAYVAFDLLALDGDDLTPLPLEERKRRLKRLLGRRRGVIRYHAHLDAPGDQVFARACRAGAEGIISKCRDAPYRTGARTPDWQKIKCIKRQEFVVGGFTDPEGARVGVGALLIGYYEDRAFRFAGKVGTGAGWNNVFGRTLRTQLDALEVDVAPFDPAPRGALAKRAHWVRPMLVAEVQFGEWTDDGKIRHPSLQGFRTDKRPKDVVREREVAILTKKKQPTKSKHV